MNILITGGCGFIGSNLIERLIKEGNFNKIYCIDNLYSSKINNILPFINQIYFINADIITFDFSKFKNIDLIYHLACPASPPIYQKDPIFTLKTLTQGTINVLECAVKNKAKIFLASTSEVYGDPQISPQNENYWGNVNSFGIRSCYDEGKRISETLFLEYHRKYNLEIRIARIFNTYGKNLNENDGRVISNFVKQVKNNLDITIYGDGTQTRSFCYISDLIDGIQLLLNSDYKKPINLGNPNEITINELAEIIISLTKSKSKIINLEMPQDDPKIRNPDITLAKEILKFEPKINLKQGLNLYI